MSVSFDTAPAPTLDNPGPPRRMGPRTIFLVVLVVVTGFSLLYLSQTSDLAATSYDVAALQDKKSVWEMRNEQLRLQIDELQSLDRVDQSASTRLNMGPPTHVVYVTAPTQPIVIPTPVPSPTPVAKGISTDTIRDLIQGLRSGEGFRVGQ